MKLNLIPQTRGLGRGPRWALGLSVACYLLALLLPCFRWYGPAGYMAGWTVLLIGFEGVKFGLWAWLANPLLFLAWLLLKLGRAVGAYRAALVAIMLASTTWLMVLVTYFPEESHVKGDQFRSFDWGVLFWIGSLGLALTSAHLAKEPLRTLEVTSRRHAKGQPSWDR